MSLHANDSTCTQIPSVASRDCVFECKALSYRVTAHFSLSALALSEQR